MDEVYIFCNMEPSSIEMDRLNASENIMTIEDKVDKNATMTEKNATMTEKNAIMIKSNKEEISKNRKRMTRIIIPMLGVLILGVGLTMGVLSGYLLRLPHQQTNGSGQIELSKPAGTYASKLHFLYCYMNMLFDKSSIIFLIIMPTLII